MAIKLIAADMDGTLLRDDKMVSDRTVRALKNAISEGIIFIPATGRVAKMIPKQIASISGIRYAVTSNGALIRDLRDQSAFYTDLLTQEQSEKIIRFFADRNLLTEAYSDGISYADEDAFRLSKSDFPKQVVDYILESQIFVKNLPGFLFSKQIPLEKINVPYVPREYREELVGRISEMPEYSVTSSGNCNIEVNAASCSKGNALKYLCTRLSISPSQVMAIGDGDNDASMLRYSGMGVAMGNSSPSARSSADFVTGTNNEDGAAYAIERFALSGG